MIVETRGHLRLARGDREGALADLRPCRRDLPGWLGFGPPFSFWRSALALALPRPEARDEALALVDEDVRRAVATGLDWPQGVALQAARLVRGGDEGLGCLCRVGRAPRSVTGPPRARALPGASWAPRCAAAGGAPGRVSRWPRGWSSRTPAGPSGSSARAGEELRARRARGRAASCARAWAALTASEQRTARLAADGRSNTQVAQELFVSLKSRGDPPLARLREARPAGAAPEHRRLLADVLEDRRGPRAGRPRRA